MGDSGGESFKSHRQVETQLLTSQLQLTSNPSRVGVICHKWHQCYLPRPLNRSSKSALMFSTNASATTRLNLSSFRDEPSYLIYFFVVYMCNFFHTERAHFTTAHEPSSRSPSRAARTSRATGSSTWASTATATESRRWSAWASRSFCGHASSNPFRVVSNLIMVST